MRRGRDIMREAGRLMAGAMGLSDINRESSIFGEMGALDRHWKADRLSWRQQRYRGGSFLRNGLKISGAAFLLLAAVADSAESVATDSAAADSVGGEQAQSGTFEIETVGRTAFVRMERDVGVMVAVTNGTGEEVTGGEVRVRLGDDEKAFSLPALAPQASHRVELSVDTAVRPGSYPLTVTVSAPGVESRWELSVAIVSRPLPQVMPVVMWGGGDLETLQEIGFTHHLAYLANYGKIWEAGEPTEAGDAEQLEKHARSLDERLTRGVGAAVYLYPGRWMARNEKLLEEYRRIGRDGVPYDKDNICGRFPEAQRFAYDVGASIARSFGRFPALQASLVHSEIRDATSLCFHEHDRQAYREFAGRDIPAEAVSKSGIRHGKIAGFPRDRVVADDDPVLGFYRWFWKGGDGWNELHTQVHRGLKSTGRRDLWTFFDPAVRVPSVWGSGGGVDVVSQWTYSYPDPLKIGQAADELFAMAAGNADQQVMKMTQVIWYRSQTAPQLPEDEESRAQWERDIPDARFITIAPDHLREAFWAKLARPIRGIMYHGWGSLVGAEHGSYRYTNPRTREVLEELTRTVVRPLGPTLLQVPDRPADVALLESFASQVFAGRGTSGWGRSWEADAHLVLQWAQLQPQIVYDEQIQRDGLEGFRVLVLPGCDVLTEGVAEQIQTFQDQGGLVVADEHVAPAILPDIVLSTYQRTSRADEDKVALQEKAAALRQELDLFYRRYVDSSNPDVVVRARQYGAADYLFAINDRRDFGDYVGHHGLVMEKGLPASAILSVQRRSGQVYDLLNHAQVAARVTDGGLEFGTDLGPGGGSVYLIVDQAIAGVRIEAPEQVGRGDRVEIEARIVDAAGEPVGAVIPVQVEILDGEGRPAEFSGYYGARDGQLALTLDIAANDAPGEWMIRLTELASGRSAARELVVR